MCGELGVYTVISISKAVGNLGEFLVVAEGWTDVWLVYEEINTKKILVIIFDLVISNENL